MNRPLQIQVMRPLVQEMFRARMVRMFMRVLHHDMLGQLHGVKVRVTQENGRRMYGARFLPENVYDMYNMNWHNGNARNTYRR